MAENKTIFVLNAGSSSTKFSNYDFNTLEKTHDKKNIVAIGHRIVHGGSKYVKPILIDEIVLTDLKKLIPIAPLHQPAAIKIIEYYKNHYKNILQIACFDTMFHATRNDVSKRYAVPCCFLDESTKAFGFHGLSYEYIASQLTVITPKKAKGKVVVMHLGNGASICALNNLKSLDTTMGFSPLDGLVMGTRSGAIDPGLLLYLMKEKEKSIDEMIDILYNKSGLLGISEISHDMKILIESQSLKAHDAIEYFVYKAAYYLSAMVMSISGIDVLVFTGGIGENCAKIRTAICKKAKWLGVEIEDEKNAKNELSIHSKNSDIEVYVLKTNEELMIAKHVKKYIETIAP